MQRKNEIYSWELNGSAYLQGRATLTINATPAALLEIRDFMASNNPAGIPEHIRQQANAWKAVSSALDEVAPSWRDGDGDDTGKSLAVAAIKRLGAPPPKPAPEPLPFDLEAAKRGEAVQTRDGRKARFVAYVPEAAISSRVIALIEGSSHVSVFGIDGEQDCYHGSPQQLFMAPKPRRTVFANIYPDGRSPCKKAYFHDNEDIARAKAETAGNAIAIAVPVEIDA